MCLLLFKIMRGIDLMDQELQYYKFPHKTKKWWLRVFHHILEISAFNAFLIWKKAKSDKDSTYLDFKETLAK